MWSGIRLNNPYWLAGKWWILWPQFVPWSSMIRWWQFGLMTWAEKWRNVVRNHAVGKFGSTNRTHLYFALKIKLDISRILIAVRVKFPCSPCDPVGLEKESVRGATCSGFHLNTQFISEYFIYGVSTERLLRQSATYSIILLLNVITYNCLFYAWQSRLTASPT